MVANLLMIYFVLQELIYQEKYKKIKIKICNTKKADLQTLRNF